MFMASVTEFPIPSYADRVNIVGLRLLSLERPAYKVGTWDLGFLEGSHHSLTNQSGSRCLNCMPTV